MTRVAERRAARYARNRSLTRWVGAAAAAVGLAGAVAGVIAPDYSDERGYSFTAPTTDHTDGVRPIDRTKTKEPTRADATPTPTVVSTSPDDHDTGADPADPTPTGGGGTGRTTGSVAGESPGGPVVAPGSPPASPSPSGEPDAGGEGPPASTGNDVVDLVNAERAATGCAPLVIDGGLTATAQGWSETMAATDDAADGELTHSPGAGVTYGENVAAGYETAEAVVAGWMGSPGHRANILNCGYTVTGAAYVADDTGPYWTQTFQ